ncbi:hypothetical protein GCM10023196_003040 [Actinoallomurus vinaceus]|uniref:Uncharacterized protein n=1 Tax=Actinoallomurus vinaceus TaxID=1080074 RepID=A0ABP8U1X9_9ACTN
MCCHRPHCPPADAVDRAAARTVARHPEQGWSLLCNGVVLFDDTREFLPDGGAVPPHRPSDVRRLPVPEARSRRMARHGPQRKPACHCCECGDAA